MLTFIVLPWAWLCWHLYIFLWICSKLYFMIDSKGATVMDWSRLYQFSSTNQDFLKFFRLQSLLSSYICSTDFNKNIIFKVFSLILWKFYTMYFHNSLNLFYSFNFSHIKLTLLSPKSLCKYSISSNLSCPHTYRCTANYWSMNKPQGTKIL